MLLTGAFTRAIDEKLRLAIPKKVRDALRSQLPDVLYVTPGTDRSLAIYTEETLAVVAQRVAIATSAGPDVRAFSRLFFSQAERVELDQQGRIRIPPELARWAGIGREAMLLGVQDHLELWDKLRWDEYLSQRRGEYDRCAEAALSNGNWAPASAASDEKPLK